MFKNEQVIENEQVNEVNRANEVEASNTNEATYHSEPFCEETPSKWSEELLEAYGKLELPSLFDYLVTQEKLASEIRKQNKELQFFRIFCSKMEQNLVETLVSVKENLKNNENEWQQTFERFDSLETKLNVEQIPAQQSSCNEILMHMLDSMRNFLEVSQTTLQELLQIVPEGRHLFRYKKPKWRVRFEEMIQSYLEGTSIVRDKLMVCLHDIQVVVIAPQPGDLFDPHLHRAIEQVPGKKSNIIAKVIRYGYSKNNTILRFADVIVTY